MAVTEFDPSEGPSAEQQAAEAAALEQGEKIAQLQQEDRERKFQQTEDENINPDLIGGKFKSQDDLLKAYEELQRKLGNNEEEQVEEEEAVEATQEEAVEETPPEVVETVNYMHELNSQYQEQGQLSEEAIDKLASMDSKELIKAYLQYNQQANSAALAANEIVEIQNSVGGPDAYTEMVQWAAANLPAEEIADYNAVTSSNDPVAAKFAVAALANRYRENVGYEAPLVSGKATKSAPESFRSHAELSRAIADPRYQTDPAYRADVEKKLARSTDLL